MIKAPNRHNTNAKRKPGGCQVFIAERKAKRVKRVNFLLATYYDHVSSGAISDHHRKFGQNKNNMNIQLFIPTRAVHICLFNSWTNTPEKNGVLPQTSSVKLRAGIKHLNCMEAVCKQEEREEEENRCINRQKKKKRRKKKRKKKRIEEERGRTRKQNKKWNIYRRSVTHHDAEVMRCAILFELVRRIVLVGRK